MSQDTPDKCRQGLRAYVRIARLTIEGWAGEGVIHWGAALSYYTLFSMGPLLVFLVGTAGMLFDASTAQAEILNQLREVLGPRGADIAETVLREASFPGFRSPASLLSLSLTLLGATAVFNNVQGALNEIWNVKPVTGTVRNALRTRLMSFIMILLLGALIVVFLIASTVASVIAPFIEARLPLASGIVRVIDLTVSTAALWLAFATVYRVLPDVRIAWRDVWVGALTTALLFALGKYLISAILGQSDVGSAFGAAGSLFALMVWIYYSAQIFLIGATFTEIWAHSQGRPIRPASYAARVSETVEDASD